MTFGDNGKSRIIGYGSIGNNSLSLIENVLLVDGLKHLLEPRINFRIFSQSP